MSKAKDILGIKEPVKQSFQLGNKSIEQTENYAVKKDVQTQALSATDVIIAKNLSVDTPTLVVDSVNRRVGYGTATPNRKFTVYDNAAPRVNVNSPSSAEPGWELWNNGAFSSMFYRPANTNDMRFYVGGADRFSLTNTGKVGIGTSAPTAKLHIIGCTAVANTASLKIDPGTLATVPVSGNIESDGTHLYWTDSGGTRRQLD